jgi:hypothetical protein
VPPPMQSTEPFSSPQAYGQHKPQNHSKSSETETDVGSTTV